MYVDIHICIYDHMTQNIPVMFPLKNAHYIYIYIYLNPITSPISYLIVKSQGFFPADFLFQLIFNNQSNIYTSGENIQFKENTHTHIQCPKWNSHNTLYNIYV